MNADGVVGMMDLWASARLLEVKGNEVYMAGIRAAAEADPSNKIVKVKSLGNLS